jgi:23S rRNA (uracil1939-C5)-methyltransferase
LAVVERPKRDDILDVTVGELAFGGQGVARADGFVVFCDDTAPGDQAKVRVRKARRRFAEARLEEVVVPGPSRIAVPCPKVPRCGGCRLQHVAYETTLAAKRDQVAEHLARIGHLPDVPVLDPDPAIERFGYRNKMEYSAAPDGAGGLRLGFHERGRWDAIVDVDDCLIATPLGNRLREAVRRWAIDEGVTPYDQRAQSGVLRHVVTRVGVNTDQALVNIVTTGGAEELVDGLAERLATDCPELVGLVHSVNDGVAEVTSGLVSRLVWGNDFIEERIHDVTLRLSAGAFFQTNTKMAERLYDRAAEAAGLTGDEVLYDLYAGAGSVGLVLAPKAREVVAIEIVEDAVRDAEANAARNGLERYQALCGDVRVVLREQREGLPAPDVAIVDPPRAGLSGGAVRRILELAPPVLVYISCQPATFADNAKRFVDGGYTLEWVRPVDMFPQTPHIEAVARFTR